MSAMNWTCKLLALALAAMASLSLDFCAQSPLDSQLNKAREEMNTPREEAREKMNTPREEAREKMKLFSMESVGACQTDSSASQAIRGSGKPYADAEAYQVYSALIPELPPIPETKTWFIRIDTVPTRGCCTIRHANYGSRQGARTLLWMTTTR
jgi:hypothetical protein